MSEKRFDEEINLFVLASFLKKNALVIGACAVIGLIGASVLTSQGAGGFRSIRTTRSCENRAAWP